MQNRCSPQSTNPELTTDISTNIKRKLSARGRLVRFFVLLLFLGALVIVGGLYISLSPATNESLYGRILFYPRKMCTKFKDFKKHRLNEPEHVIFKNGNGDKLTGWYFKSPIEKRVVVLSHGQGGDITYMLPYVRPLMDLDCSVLLYNFRGYGDSEGIPSLVGICDDGIAAFDYLVKERRLNQKKIYVAGISLGSGVACDTAQAREAAGVILLSPYSSLARAAHELMFPLRIFPAFLFPKNGLDNAIVMSKCKTPLLVLHGAKDGLFSLDHANMIFQSAAGPKQMHIFQECGHGDISMCQDEYRDALAAFFQEMPE